MTDQPKTDTAEIVERLRVRLHNAASNRGYDYQSYADDAEEIGYDAELDSRAADRLEELEAFALEAAKRDTATLASMTEIRIKLEELERDRERSVIRDDTLVGRIAELEAIVSSAALDFVIYGRDPRGWPDGCTPVATIVDYYREHLAALAARDEKEVEHDARRPV